MGGRIYEYKFEGNLKNGSNYRFYNKEKVLTESRNAIVIENVGQLIPLEKIKLLDTELDVNSGKSKVSKEHYMDENLFKENSQDKRR